MVADPTHAGFDQFLDAVAARSPTPGGGAVAAAVAALGAALGRMVAAYAIGKKSDEATRSAVEQFASRLGVLDELARALIHQDAEAYDGLTMARQEWKAATGPETIAGLRKAVLTAVSVPMEIVAVTVRTLATLQELSPVASKYLSSDLEAAAILADAAARAAACMVRTNLPEIGDELTRNRVTCELDQLLSKGVNLLKSIESGLKMAAFSQKNSPISS